MNTRTRTRTHFSVTSGLRRILYGSSALLALSLTACGDGSDGVPADDGMGGSDGSGGSGGSSSTSNDVGQILDSAIPCTEPGTVCVPLQVPETLSTTPVSLQFVLYDSDGVPNRPPNGFAGMFTAPQLTAGEMIHIQVTDGGMRGDYWLWAIMYMTGGGYGAPVVGVDYGQTSPPLPVHLDGTPLNIAEPVTLGLSDSI